MYIVNYWYIFHQIYLTAVQIEPDKFIQRSRQALNRETNQKFVRLSFFAYFYLQTKAQFARVLQR
jgi:hypothetical protein